MACKIVRASHLSVWARGPQKRLIQLALHRSTASAGGGRPALTKRRADWASGGLNEPRPHGTAAILPKERGHQRQRQDASGNSSTGSSRLTGTKQLDARGIVTTRRPHS